jgi:hypothetical protein
MSADVSTKSGLDEKRSRSLEDKNDPTLPDSGGSIKYVSFRTLYFCYLCICGVMYVYLAIVMVLVVVDLQ